MAWEQSGSFPQQEVGWVIQVSVAGHPPRLTLVVSCPSVYPKMLGAEGPNPSPFRTWGAKGGLKFVTWTLWWRGPPFCHGWLEVMMEGGWFFLSWDVLI